MGLLIADTNPFVSQKKLRTANSPFFWGVVYGFALVIYYFYLKYQAIYLTLEPTSLILKSKQFVCFVFKDILFLCF
jgi:hypothetical protein